MTRTWLPLAITLAIQATAAMALVTLPAMAPRVAQALAISPAYIGMYVAIAYLGAITASLAAGPAVGRYGSIRVSQWALLLCGAGLALCAVPMLPALALGAFLIGLGNGPVTPASSHLLARTTPAHRMSLVFSVKQTGVPLGGALAGAIVPSLQQWAGWQWALLLVAAACLLCIAPAQWLRAEFDADRDPRRPLGLGQFLEPIRLVLGHPRLRMLSACSFVFSTVQMSLTAYLVTYLTDSLAYAMVAAGFMLATAQVGAVVGRVAWGWLADRWLGARRTLALLATLMAACVLAMAALPAGAPVALVVLVLVVYGASGVGWNGVYLAEIARQAPPGQAGMATGGTLAITFLGVVLGPPVFGAISGLAGTFRAGYAALGLPLALCVWMLLRRAQGNQART